MNQYEKLEIKISFIEFGDVMTSSSSGDYEYDTPTFTEGDDDMGVIVVDVLP